MCSEVSSDGCVGRALRANEVWFMSVSWSKSSTAGVRRNYVDLGITANAGKDHLDPFPKEGSRRAPHNRGIHIIRQCGHWESCQTRSANRRSRDIGQDSAMNGLIPFAICAEPCPLRFVVGEVEAPLTTDWLRTFLVRRCSCFEEISVPIEDDALARIADDDIAVGVHNQDWRD